MFSSEITLYINSLEKDTYRKMQCTKSNYYTHFILELKAPKEKVSVLETKVQTLQEENVG